MYRNFSQRQLDDIRNRFHRDCVICGNHNGQPPLLHFVVEQDGSVEANFPGGDHYQGYIGWLHGGLVTALLDAAMTNCLFAHGHCGITGMLNTRFRHPVTAEQPMRIRAWLERSSPPLFVLQAQLVQENQVRAEATGKFMEKPEMLNQ